MKTAVLPPFVRTGAFVGLSACFGVGLIAWSGKTNQSASLPNQASERNGSQKPEDGSGAISGETISDADARQFTDKMIKAIRRHDVPAIASLIDVDTLAKNSVADMNIPNMDMEEFTKGLTRGMKNSMMANSGLPAQLAANIANGGTCNLLRYVEVNHQKRARLRLIFANSSGFNYFDLVMARNTEGQVMARDMYIFYSGELLSQTTRRLALQLAAQRDNHSALEGLQGKDADLIKYAEALKKMAVAFAEKRPADAGKIYNTLPDSLKQDKALKLAHLRITQSQGDAEYSRAMTDFRASFPNDPACELLNIDYYTARKEYDKAQGAVDILDKTVGGDPYLNVSRGVLFIMQQKMSLAQQSLEKAAQGMPANKDVQALVVVISLQNKRYQTVLNALIALKKAGDAPSDIAHDPDFAGFRHSPQYQQWRKLK